jgi:hypothetical protein
VALAKTQFDKANRSLKSQLTAELESPPEANHEPPRA